MSKQPELVDGFLKKKLDESWKLLQPTQNSGEIIYGKDRDLERQDTLRAEEWQELIPMIKHPLETEVGEVFFGQQNTIKVQGHVVEAKSGCKIKPGIYSLEENDDSRQKFGYKGSTADYRLNNTALLNWYKDDANFNKLIELNPVTKTDWTEFGQGPYASKGVRLRNLDFHTGFYQYVKRYIPLEKDSGVIFDVSGGCHIVGTVAYLDENGLVSPYDKAKKKTWRLKTGLSNIFQPEFDFRESDEEYNIEEINNAIQQDLSEYLKTTTKTNFGTGLYTTEDKIPAQWKEQSKLVLLYLYNQTNTGTIIGQDWITMQIMAPVEVNFLEGNPYSEAFFKKPFFFDELGLIPVGFEGESESERGELAVYYKKGYVEVKGRVLNADGCLVPPGTYNLKKCNRENALNLDSDQFDAGNKTRYRPGNRVNGYKYQLPVRTEMFETKQNNARMRTKLHYIPTSEWVNVDTSANVVLCTPMTIDNGSFLNCVPFTVTEKNEQANELVNKTFLVHDSSANQLLTTSTSNNVSLPALFKRIHGAQVQEVSQVANWYPVRFSSLSNSFVPPLHFAGTMFNTNYLAKRHNLPYSRFSYPEMDEFIRRREFFFDYSLFNIRMSKEEAFYTVKPEWDNLTPLLPARSYLGWMGVLHANLDVQSNKEREKYAGFFKLKDSDGLIECENHKFVAPSSTFNTVIEFNNYFHGRAKKPLIKRTPTTRYPVLFSTTTALDQNEPTIINGNIRANVLNPGNIVNNTHGFLDITFNDEDIKKTDVYPFSTAMKRAAVLNARMHVCDYDLVEYTVNWNRYSGMFFNTSGFYNLDLLFSDMIVVRSNRPLEDVLFDQNTFIKGEIEFNVVVNQNNYSNQYFYGIRYQTDRETKKFAWSPDKYPYFEISQTNLVGDTTIEAPFYFSRYDHFPYNIVNKKVANVSHTVNGLPYVRVKLGFDNNIYRLNYYNTYKQGRNFIMNGKRESYDIEEDGTDLKRKENGINNNAFRLKLTDDENTTKITDSAFGKNFAMKQYKDTEYSFNVFSSINRIIEQKILFDQRGFIVKEGASLFQIRTQQPEAFLPPIGFAHITNGSDTLISLAQNVSNDTLVINTYPQQICAFHPDKRSKHVAYPEGCPFRYIDDDNLTTDDAEDIMTILATTPQVYYESVNPDHLNKQEYNPDIPLINNLFNDSCKTELDGSNTFVRFGMVGWRRSVFSLIVDFTGVRRVGRGIKLIDGDHGNKVWVSKFGGLQTGSGLLYDSEFDQKGDERISFKAVKHFLTLFYPDLLTKYRVSNVVGPLGEGVFPYPIDDYWTCKRSLQQFSRDHVFKD